MTSSSRRKSCSERGRERVERGVAAGAVEAGWTAGRQPALVRESRRHADRHRHALGKRSAVDPEAPLAAVDGAVLDALGAGRAAARRRQTCGPGSGRVALSRGLRGSPPSQRGWRTADRVVDGRGPAVGGFRRGASGAVQGRGARSRATRRPVASARRSKSGSAPTVSTMSATRPPISPSSPPPTRVTWWAPAPRRPAGPARWATRCRCCRSGPPRLRALIKALRPHQWAKNALVAMPVLLAPGLPSWRHIVPAGRGHAVVQPVRLGRLRLQRSDGRGGRPRPPDETPATLRVWGAARGVRPAAVRGAVRRSASGWRSGSCRLGFVGDAGDLLRRHPGLFVSAQEQADAGRRRAGLAVHPPGAGRRHRDRQHRSAPGCWPSRCSSSPAWRSPSATSSCASR